MKSLKSLRNGGAENDDRLTIEFSVMYNISIYCYARGMSVSNITRTEAFDEKLVTMDDEAIIEAVHQGHSEALDYLIKKYRNFVRAKARSYFLIGADKEDIVQEGTIGLYKAIRDYREDKLTSFKAFAELCITRQIITAIKTATRQKHIPLNSYVSLDKPIYDDESDRTLLDVISGAKVMILKLSSSTVKNSIIWKIRWPSS